MKQQINLHGFQQAFEAHGRREDFSPSGLRALFDWLEDYEDSTGEEIDLDVIALCCDFSELTLAAINVDYQRDYASLDEAAEALQMETTVIAVDDETIILQAF